jgi:hypothetical protein
MAKLLTEEYDRDDANNASVAPKGSGFRANMPPTDLAPCLIAAGRDFRT